MHHNKRHSVVDEEKEMKKVDQFVQAEEQDNSTELSVGKDNSEQETEAL